MFSTESLAFASIGSFLTCAWIAGLVWWAEKQSRPDTQVGAPAPGTPTAVERLQRVAGFDLGPVRRRYIARRAATTEEQAIQVEQEFRRYCVIVALGDGEFGMNSQKVDDFWHEAILCSSLYREWCQAVAGRLIHHDPSEEEESGPPPAVDVPACRTWNAYVAAFHSEPPADLWPRPLGLDGTAALTAT